MNTLLAGIIGLLVSVIGSFLAGRISGTKNANAKNEAKRKEESIKKSEAEKKLNDEINNARREVQNSVNSSSDDYAVNELRENFNRDKK